MGASITCGPTLIGQVEGLLRDPISHRVRRLITSYGVLRRRVAVPIEWVVKRSASQLVLGVSARSLDDLDDHVPPAFTRSVLAPRLASAMREGQPL
jgi:hypothetical protein